MRRLIYRRLQTTRTVLSNDEFIIWFDDNIEQQSSIAKRLRGYNGRFPSILPKYATTYKPGEPFVVGLLLDLEQTTGARTVITEIIPEIDNKTFVYNFHTRLVYLGRLLLPHLYRKYCASTYTSYIEWFDQVGIRTLRMDNLIEQSKFRPIAKPHSRQIKEIEEYGLCN